MPAAASAQTYRPGLRLSNEPKARAEGARVWDRDGRAYVDFCNSFGAVLLGHGDPDVEAAVAISRANQSRSAAWLEGELGERLRSSVPCADAARFGRVASEATAEALRIARVHTGRRRILACGVETAAFTAFPFDDLPALSRLLELYPGEVAAIVISPAYPKAPSFGYLQAVRRLANSHGALLVFDETISGFRLHPGGAQALFGAVPDFAVFGPGMANGYPLAALVGSKPLMSLAQPTPASADSAAVSAALTVLHKLELCQVPSALRVRGAEIQAEVAALLESTGASGFLRIAGEPACSVLEFGGPGAERLQALFTRETLARGLLVSGGHFVSYAHGDAEIDRLVEAYAGLLPGLVAAAQRFAR